MNADEVIAVVLLMGLVAVVYGPWQWACADLMRQACFETRDAIFDLAASGKLDFSSPEYKRLRTSIEGRIRFAHEATIPHIVWLGAVANVSRRFPSGSIGPADSELASGIVDADVRAIVQKRLNDLNQYTIFVLLLRSPILLIAALSLSPFYMAFAAVKDLARTAARRSVAIIQLGAQIEDEPRALASISRLNHA